ncbi:hypothetical protein QMM60_06105, partial [Leptospira santarosai]|nr:hypothetical protein [Leptospira santarosai]
STGRGLCPKGAINLPPAFLTPSNQEYHTSICLTSKNHTNLRIAFGNSVKRSLRIAFGNSVKRSLRIAFGNSVKRSLRIAFQVLVLIRNGNYNYFKNILE